MLNSLSNVSVPSVSTAPVSAPVNPSAAVLNIPPANLSSQHSLVVGFNVGIRRDVLGPELHLSGLMSLNLA